MLIGKPLLKQVKATQDYDGTDSISIPTNTMHHHIHNFVLYSILLFSSWFLPSIISLPVNIWFTTPPWLAAWKLGLSRWGGPGGCELSSSRPSMHEIDASTSSAMTDTKSELITIDKEFDIKSNLVKLHRAYLPTKNESQPSTRNSNSCNLHHLESEPKSDWQSMYIL